MAAWRQFDRLREQSWSTLWKTALVRLPRAVPDAALRITSPEGPQPFKMSLSCREPGRKVQLYVFVPPVRFPHPESSNPVPTPHSFPVVMDYHGGGFYLGSCLEQAPFCAKLCRELQAVVIGVDYRMAPLDRFPAAIEDAEEAVLALFDTTHPGFDELREAIAAFLRGQWHDKLGAEGDRDRDSVPLPPEPKIELDTSRIAFSGASSGG